MTAKCKHCGKFIIKLTPKGRAIKFCDRKCREAHYHKQRDIKHRLPRTRIYATCPICGNRFISRLANKTHHPRKYCSGKCAQYAYYAHKIGVAEEDYLEHAKSVGGGSRGALKECMRCGAHIRLTHTRKQYCTQCAEYIKRIWLFKYRHGDHWQLAVTLCDFRNELRSFKEELRNGKTRCKKQAGRH